MDKYTELFLDSVESKENRNSYSTSIQEIRKKVKEIWEYPQHRYFTDHSIKHSERILRYLWPLTRPCQDKLSDAEIYILVAAAYLHDVGMQSEKLGADLRGNRRRHQELSVEMIEAMDLGVLGQYKDDLGLVVRAHRHIPLDGDEYKATGLYGDPVRPRLLGSILRLADELDLTGERVNMSRQEYQNIGVEALVHWYRHLYVKDVRVEDVTKRIHITYRFPKEQLDDCKLVISNYIQTIIDDTLREIERYIWDYQTIFRLEPPDIGESGTVESLPNEVLERLRLEADNKTKEREESNRITSSSMSDLSSLMPAIREAEQKEMTGEPIDAAVRFKSIADRFMRNKQYARAADYADRVAILFAAHDDERAWEAHLLTAQAHLGRNDPQVAAPASNAALLRVIAQGDQVAELHVRLVSSTIYRLLVDVARAEENLAECVRLISAIQQSGQTVEESLQASVYDELAQTALLDDQWDDAATHLRKGLAVLTGAPSRLRLLIRLANVYLELGRADDAAPRVTDALGLVDASEDATTKAAVYACAAHLAALRDDIDDMIAHYDTAIGALAGHAQEPYASALYLEKHSQLSSADVVGVKEELTFREQGTRIDLARERLHPLVDARQLELEGVAEATDNKVPDALQSYNQALSIYRQYGAFESVRRTLRRLAQLYEQGNRPIDALTLYARIGAIVEVERLSTAYVQRLDSVDEIDSFLQSISISQTDHARVGRAVVYQEFADVVPDEFVPRIIDNLIDDIVNGHDSSSQRLAVRRTAIQALAVFSRRISQDRLETVIETYLTVPRKGSWWTTEQVAIKGVARIASQRHAMPETLVTRVTTALLNKATSENFDILRDESLQAVFTIAKHVGGKQRDAVVEYLQGREQGPKEVAYLTALDAPPAPERLHEVVREILANTSPKGIWAEGEVRIRRGGYAPGIFDFFKKRLIAPCPEEIVEHFVNGYDNEDATIGLRAAMLEELGDLAHLIPDQDIDRCYDAFLRASNGDVVVRAKEASDIEMARNPFSRIHVFTGTEAEIAVSGAWGLACLYHRLPQEQRLEALRVLRKLANRDDTALLDGTTLRQRVGQAMGELRDLDNNGLEQLAVSIIVLLHDSKPDVRARMVQSVATLYEHNSLDVNRTIIGRILDLGVRDVYLDVRQAVAFALNRLPIASLPPDLADIAMQARTRLEADINFRVRMPLAGERE